MKRILLTCLVALLILVLFVSCGNQKTPANSSEESTVKSEELSTEKPTNQVTTASSPNPKPPTPNQTTAQTDVTETPTTEPIDPSLHTADVDDITASGWVPGWN